MNIRNTSPRVYAAPHGHPGLLMAAAFLIGILCLIPTAAQAQYTFPVGSTSADIAVTNFYNELPYTGYAPLTIKITNRGSRDGIWKLNTSAFRGYGGTGAESSIVLKIKAGETRRFNHLAPLAAPGGQPSDNQSLEVMLEGPGVEPSRRIATQNTGFGGGGTDTTPFFVLGNEVAAQNRSSIETALSGYTSVALSTVDFASAPEDWRGYAGASAIILAWTEWQSMTSEQHLALLNWVGTGGRLMIAAQQPQRITRAEIGPLDSESAGTARLAERHFFRGLGDILIFPWDGRKIGDPDPLAIALNERWSGFATMEEAYVGRYEGFELGEQNVSDVQLNIWLILFFLVTFAVVVGPVNLFVFARGQKRYRLFWTTPLISIVTSILLLVLILLQDGTGGNGTRASITIFSAGDNTPAVTWQEQMSRTGLLLNSTFESDPGAWLIHAPINFSSYYSGNEESTVSVVEGNYSGSWFRSRQRQAQLACRVEYTGADLNVSFPEEDDSAPRVRSRFGFPLQNVYVVVNGSTVWHIDKLNPGEEVIAPQGGSVTEVMETIKSSLGRMITARVEERLDDQTTFWVAMAEKPDKDFSIPTLKSINWTIDRQFFLGFVSDEPIE